MAVSDRIAVLEAGRVHQVGSPQEIYHAPRSAFVARFIGNSNVFDARVRDVAGGMATVSLGPETAAVEVRIAATDADTQAGPIQAVAIRPEHIRVTSPEAPGVARARATSSEFTGLTTNIEADWSGQHVGITLVNGEAAPRTGEVIGLEFPADKLRIVTP
jgi:iron(III) transport system ATP-binding protein